jgi:AcrR family transcriptional regulator
LAHRLLQEMKESSADKKQSILDTAETLFAQYGYDPTSTREIAEKAGVNVAMISYYFGSKENLLKAIIERYGAAVLADLKKGYNPADTPEARLKSLIGIYIRYAFSHPEPIVIAHREKGLSMRPEMQESIHCVYTEIKEMIESAIQQGQKSGIFRDLDTQLFIFTVGGMMEHLVHELHTMQLFQADPTMYGVSRLDDTGFRDRFADLIWELVDGYLKKR